MQTRRSFFSSIGKIVAGFSILPSAMTYARNWKPTESGIIIPYQGIAMEEDVLINTGLILNWNLQHLKMRLNPILLEMQNCADLL